MLSIVPGRDTIAARACFRAVPGPGGAAGWAPEARLGLRVIRVLASLGAQGGPASYSAGPWSCASAALEGPQSVLRLLVGVRGAQGVEGVLLTVRGVSLEAVNRVVTALGEAIAERYEPGELSPGAYAGPFSVLRDIIPRAGLGKSTVYRVLSILERSGAVRRRRTGMTAPVEAHLVSEPVLVGLSRASPRHVMAVLGSLLPG